MSKKRAEFEFEKELEARLNPVKRDWEIERDERKKKNEAENKSILNENEAYFSKPDNEIQNTFKDLHFIAQIHYLDEESSNHKTLTESTKERLTKILKDSIHSPLSPELLSVKSLIESSPQANRNIDIVYYVSCSLNSDIDFSSFESVYIKYLYLNCVIHERISNVIKGKFSSKLEEQNPRLAKEAIQDSLMFLLGKFWPANKELFMFYIGKIKSIDKLKELVNLHGTEENTGNNLLENFLKGLNFKISEKDLQTISKEKTSAENMLTILALLAFSRRDKKSFSQSHAVALFDLLGHNKEIFSDLLEEQKIDLLDLMFNQFNTEESIKFIGGLQSTKARCASFLKREALSLLTNNELKKLRATRSEGEDIWTFRIAHSISENEQVQADQVFSRYSVTQIKEFLFQSAIITERAFFDEVRLRLDELRVIIEGNRENDKEPFFNSDGTSKIETACRDEVFRCLKKQYSSYLELTREKHEGNNQVDINIKYRKNSKFEVQVECKKDSNSEIYSGLQDQLIGKYLLKKVKFGIYLIFYFGVKADKGKFLKRVNESIPQDYEDRISVVCFDLR